MSIAIADHIRDIPRSGIRDFFEIVQSMDDVISLGIGEPDFATPWHIREAAIYALERGRTGYTSNLGLPRLRRSISEYINKHFGIRYEPLSEILVSVGVSEAIDLAWCSRARPHPRGGWIFPARRGFGEGHHAALPRSHAEFPD